MITGLQRGEGAQTLTLRDDGLEVVLLPDHGGKILSLVDRRTGRDWLWRNPYLPLKPPVPGASYVLQHDTGGFDECFPAVSEGAYPIAPWQDQRIPDHGELWSVPWSADVSEAGITMVAETERFPVRFERKASLRDGTLRLEYRASNPTDHDFPFIWSAHPLLALEEGMCLELPEGQSLSVYGSDLLGDRHTPVTWPFASGMDLSRITRAGYSAKLAGPAPARGWVGLTHEDRMLRMAYDPGEVPDLGLWLNMGGWTPLPGKEAYFNLGLEPCIGWGDDLAYAIANGQSHGCVKAHGERRWWLELRVEDALNPGKGGRI